MRLTMAGASDIGRTRSRNEDAIAWDSGRGLLVLADGMGGHLAGEVASRLAVEHIVARLHGAPPEPQAEERVRAAVEEANALIHAKSAVAAPTTGMGTTVVVALFVEEAVVAAHVGDSRLYRFREGRLERLTADHSLVQELVDEGYLSEEEARAAANRNVITRALGIDREVRVAIQRHPVRDGDLYLACSDGLTDLVGEAEITSAITAEGDLQGLAERLVAMANQMGGSDNISVIVARVTADGGAAAAMQRGANSGKVGDSA